MLFIYGPLRRFPRSAPRWHKDTEQYKSRETLGTIGMISPASREKMNQRPMEPIPEDCTRPMAATDLCLPENRKTGCAYNAAAGPMQHKDRNNDPDVLSVIALRQAF